MNSAAERGRLALALCTELRSVHALSRQHARAALAWPRSRRRNRGGGKPSPEEIARRRASRRPRTRRPRRRSPRLAPAPAKSEARDPGAELAALRAFALGGGVELVDIGTNLQTRGSYADVARQLRRAAAAGVRARRAHRDATSPARARAGALRSGGRSRRAAAATTTTTAAAAPRLPRLLTAGVHPHDARKWDATTAEAIRELARSPACVSLGECGLDYDRMFSPRDTQLRVFEEQCALAAELGRPLFVHVRERDADKGAPLGAYADALAVLAKVDGERRLPAARGACTASRATRPSCAAARARRVRRLHWLCRHREAAGATIAALRALGVARRSRRPRGRARADRDGRAVHVARQAVPADRDRQGGLRRAARTSRAPCPRRRRRRRAPATARHRPRTSRGRRPPPRSSSSTCARGRRAHRALARRVRGRGRDRAAGRGGRRRRGRRAAATRLLLATG